MRYQGSKARYVGGIVGVLSSEKRDIYYEPFVGSAVVAVEVVPYFDKLFLSDANVDLIDMWKAAIEGWRPPLGHRVTPEEYADLEKDESSPWRTWVGFNHSFAYGWFQGYSYNNSRVSRLLWEQLDWAARIFDTPKVEFRCCDYKQVSAEPNSTIYCDPPYFDTSGYKAVDSFDNRNVFWSTMTRWSMDGARVFVSETNAPPHPWSCVWEQPRPKIGTTGHQEEKLERVYSIV